GAARAGALRREFVRALRRPRPRRARRRRHLRAAPARMTLVLFVGGARSGKSRLALERAAETGGEVVFVATGEAGDEEMTARIEQPRRGRPQPWPTVAV